MFLKYQNVNILDDDDADADADDDGTKKYKNKFLVVSLTKIENSSSNTKKKYFSIYYIIF